MDNSKPNFKDLVPAIVQDYYTGKVLMLAYVNEQAYEYMQKEGRTCFWSRSRNELWIKGETSGNVQYIKKMLVDCDKDTLLIQVEQTGVGACHTGAYSCFDDEFDEFSVFDDVFDTITDRQANPSDKSYTSYLLGEGIDKICKKIGEEAAETIIAAKNGNKDDLIGEISDLAYHTLVLMLAGGVSVSDIRAEFLKRHKKND